MNPTPIKRNYLLDTVTVELFKRLARKEQRSVSSYLRALARREAQAMGILLIVE